MDQELGRRDVFRLAAAGLASLAAGEQAEGARPPGASVTRVTSSSVSLAWDAGRAGGVSVALSPDPRFAVARTLTGTLPESTTSYTARGLAAGVDCFFRIQTAATTLTAHARTVGGPLEKAGLDALDTALREVHLVSPRVLLLVLTEPLMYDRSGGVEESNLAGNNGGNWQKGKWTVVRNAGREIPVATVHRRSIAVGQPAYPYMYAGQTRRGNSPQQYDTGNPVEVDHWIFLSLAEPIGPTEILTVSHAGDVMLAPTTVPVSDHYLETPLIQVNQVGYNPRATRRFAYLFQWMGDGGQLDLSWVETANVLRERLDVLAPRTVALSKLAITRRILKDGDCTLPGGPDADVREIDLAALPPVEGGRYRVQIPGVGVSWPTAVSEESQFKMFYNVGRALFHQRWSVELAPAYTDWSRPSCHGRIYKATGKPPLPWVRFPATTPVKDYIETAGGWHDAGDFNPVGHIGHLFSALLALRACEGAGLGTGLVDGQLTIPESGNGIPDLLDEALSGIQVWVDLQQPDGSIYSGAESWHDVGYMLANEDRDQGPWTYDPDVSFTTFCAGLFAHAAHLVRAFHPGKADRLRKAAVDAYGWATANGALRLTGSQSVTLYAASELYRLTGSTSYKQDYETAWDSFPYQRGPMPGNGWPRWRFKDVLLTGDCFVSFIKKEPGNVRSARDLRGGPQAFKSQAARAARTITDSTFAHRNGRFASGLAWGAGTAMARFGEMLFLGRELQDLIPLSAAERQEVFDAISLLNDYTFGCNPLGMCWVTGLGSRRPMQPLSVEWLVHVKVRQLPPLPGITIFGPTSPPGSGYYRPLQAAFYPAMNRQTLAVPPYLQYCDSRAYVNCNEYSTLTIVSTVLVVATLIAQKGWTPPPSWKPGGKEVRNPLPPFTSD